MVAVEEAIAEVAVAELSLVVAEEAAVAELVLDVGAVNVAVALALAVTFSNVSVRNLSVPDCRMAPTIVLALVSEKEDGVIDVGTFHGC